MLDMQSEDPKCKPRPDLVVAGYVSGSSKFELDVLVIANFFGSGVSLKAEA